MANSTYLELTNVLLRRLLEVELTSANFASARSTQASAKDFIRAAVDEINAAEKEWPFNYTTGSLIMTDGREEYELANDCYNPDWESFRVRKDDTLGVNTTPLKLISRDEWNKFLRPADEDSETVGIGMPQYVFDSSGGGTRGVGISPSPDESYIIDYDYYKIPDVLSLHSDETTIPQRFNYVIINFALKHFYMFKDNAEQANFWTGECNKGLSQMRHAYIPKRDSMRDTRVNFGGSPWGSANYRR